MLERTKQDLRVAHKKRWPNRRQSFLSNAILLASSRGLWALLVHRLSHAANRIKTKRGLVKIVWLPIGATLAILNYLIVVVTKIDILQKCDIEGGVLFSNSGNIIFGANYVGSGTEIQERVTVGMRLEDEGLPEIGRHVLISSDCVVYGAIKIGEGSKLLPNTVLSRTIPENIVMRGNPAKRVIEPTARHEAGSP